MKEAVGTSLMIIAIKSLLGFLGDVTTLPDIDWYFLVLFSLISIMGILLGSYFANFVPGEKLKPLFGWFVLVLGVYIIFKESSRVFGV